MRIGGGETLSIERVYSFISRIVQVHHNWNRMSWVYRAHTVVLLRRGHFSGGDRRNTLGNIVSRVLRVCVPHSVYRHDRSEGLRTSSRQLAQLKEMSGTVRLPDASVTGLCDFESSCVYHTDPFM